MNSLWAWGYVALLLAGLALNIHAVRYYRGHTDPDLCDPGTNSTSE